MLRLHSFLIISAFAFVGMPAQAQLYSDTELNAAYQKMAHNIELMVTEDIVRTVPRNQRPAAAAIQVTFEKRGPNPLSFWANPKTKTIHIPIESVRFLDDLAILQAWFDRHGCAGEHIHTYLWARLRQGRPLPSPLVAFGINREKALSDNFVNDVSGKILKLSMFFILGHEIGHLLLDHQGGLKGVASQQQEIEADTFALDRFAQIGTTPAGVVFYFIATRWRDPIGTVASLGTHPATPTRMKRIADRMMADPETFSFAEPDPQVGKMRILEMARDMKGMAEISADDKMLTLLPLGLTRDFPLSRLQRSCRG